MEETDHSPLSNDELSKIHRGRVGRYELFFRIGMGGMASVYLGRLRGEVGFERWVAIKQIHEHLGEEKTFREMFLDEARVAIQMSHPNLVQVTDVGMDNGRPYLVMEFVKGETLAHILKRCYRVKKRLPVPIAARIIAWACEGLHHAHELRGPDGELRDLVHRDLSPHNILVSYEGVVKVADFGIAKAAGRTTHTRTGIVKGKPQYMSPEQALAKPLDRRSDVFSLGILLYETTLGRRLFKEDSEFETFRRITRGDVPKPTVVDGRYPQSLEQTVMKALTVRLKDRFQSARALQSEIEQSLIVMGEKVNTADVAEFMESIFEDRIQAHDEILTWARSNPVGAPPLQHPLIDDQTVSTSMSLIPQEQEQPLSDSLPVMSPQSRGSSRRTKLIVLGLMLVAMAAATGIGALAVRLARGPSSGEGWTGSTEGEGGGDHVADLIGTGVSKAVSPYDQTPSGTSSWDQDGGESTKALSIVGVDAGALDFDAGRNSVEDLMLNSDDAGPSDADDEIWVFDLEAGPVKRRRRRPHRWRDPPAQGNGTVSVMCTPWCEVHIDGRRLGRTPLMRVSVSAGSHNVLLRPRGQGPGQRRYIRVEPGRNTPVSLNR